MSKEENLIAVASEPIRKTFPFLETQLSMLRQSSFPLDVRSLWWSKSDAAAYAKNNPTAYIGMPLSVHDESTGIVTLYIINSDKTLKEVGQRLDNRSVSLNSNGTLEIKGISQAAQGKILSVGLNGTIEYIDSQENNVNQINSEINTIKSKLETKADKNHTHRATDINQDSSHRFATDAEKNTWNSKATLEQVDEKIRRIPDASKTVRGLMTTAQVTGLEVMGQDVAQIKTDVAKFKKAEAIPVATHNHQGLLSSEDKIKLDALDSKLALKAEKNHTHRATDIIEDASHRFTTDAEKILFKDKYTKAEIDNKFSAIETNTQWKPAVATKADIAKKYPSPKDGWTVNVNDTDITYRYTGSEWIAISANAIPKATSSLDGLMSKEDKRIVDNVTANLASKADKSHGHKATDIVEDSSHRFTTDSEKVTARKSATDSTYAKNKADSNKTEIDTLNNRCTAIEEKIVLMTEAQAKAIINEYISGAFPV